MSSSSPGFSSLLDDHASQLMQEGRLEEALRAARTALSSARQEAEDGGAPTQRLLTALEMVATVHRELGQVAEAEAALKEALEVGDQVSAPKRQMANLRTSLGTLLDFSQREADAVPLYEQAIADFEELEPPEMEVSAQLRNNLAMIYKGLGKFALAEQHYLRALEVLENTRGRRSESVAAVYNNLGSLYFTAGFADQAREMFQEGLDSRIRTLGPKHPDVAQSYCNLATVCHELGESSRALEYFEQSLQVLEANIKEEAASYEAVGEDYASLLEIEGDTRKAEAFRKRMKKVLALA
ncbi:MAG: tetratricopeptide repeat protein [Verrucomicrobiales bacterium]|nr:tetratricopeptide repeat protein [Verrucomicrobiales bacterium]